METRIIPLKTENPDISTLKAVARRIVKGEICILPTDTIYGLHCRADFEEPVKVIQSLKGRRSPKPLVVLIPNETFLIRNRFRISPVARRLMDRFWPGPLTLVMPVPEGLSMWLSGDEQTLAVRWPGYPLLGKILQFADVPVVSTSINVTGHEPVQSVDEIRKRFSGKVHCILDAGPPARSIPSTIVSVVDEKPVILREGAIPRQMIFSAIETDSGSPSEELSRDREAE